MIYLLALLISLLRLAAALRLTAARRLGLGQVLDALFEQLKVVCRVCRRGPLGDVLGVLLISAANDDLGLGILV